MTFDLQKELIIRLQNNPTLSNWSSLFAVSTWERILFGRFIAKMNIYETTITQDLVYQFWKLAQERIFPIQLYQALDERSNGNDLEICVQTENGYLLMPCQAKIINKSNRYSQLKHKVKEVSQIDLLIKYGKRVKGIPIYFLYNFNSNPKQNNALEELYNIHIEELGCSVFRADFIKKELRNSTPGKLIVPSFYQLHKKSAISISQLFAAVGSHSKLQAIISSKKDIIKFYTEKELTASTQWKDMAPLPSIGKISPTTEHLLNITTNDSKNMFNPRFRILLPINKRQGKIYRLS